MTRRLVPLLAIPILLAATLLAACGDNSEGDPTAEVPPTGGNDPTAPANGGAGGTMPDTVGPPITVAEALETNEGDGFTVTGYLFVKKDGSLVLADEIAESFPPQPAGAQLTVTGFDPLTLPLVEGPTDSEIEITSWTELPIQLYGTITGGVFLGNTLPVS